MKAIKCLLLISILCFSFQLSAEENVKKTDNIQKQEMPTKEQHNPSCCDYLVGTGCGLGVGFAALTGLALYSGIAAPYIFLLNDQLNNEFNWGNYSLLVTIPLALADSGVKCWWLYELAFRQDTRFLAPYLSVVIADFGITIIAYALRFFNVRYELRNDKSLQVTQNNALFLSPKFSSNQEFSAKKETVEIEGANFGVSYIF